MFQFFNMITTVQTKILVPLEFVIMNGIILVWERWWLKLGLGYQQILFYYCCGVIAHRKISIFTSPVTSFYTRNKICYR